MFGLLNKGNKVWLSKNDNPKRKLKYTLQIIEQKNKKVGINTHLTNKIVYEALTDKRIESFKNFDNIQTEVKFGENTRFDFFLSTKKQKVFIEVKNVTLSRTEGVAEFPDTITSRGQKHINELVKANKEGYQVYILFVIQRDDCQKFEMAKDIDSKYYELLEKAVKKNLKVLCYDCKFTSKGIKLNHEIKFKIK